MSAQEFLTVEQATMEFGIHRTTIFRAISEGRLASHKTMGDRRTFVGRWDIQRLVDPPSVTNCLEVVYRHFTTTGEWPIASKLQRELDRSVGGDFDLIAALENLPRELGWRVRDAEGHAQLTLQGIARCQNSGEDVGAFLALVRSSHERYVSDDADLTVTSEQLSDTFGFDRLMLDKLYKLVQIESVFWSGVSGFPDGRWSVTIDGDRIRRFRDVQSVSDYLAIKQQMFQMAAGPWPAAGIVPSARRIDAGLHPAVGEAVHGLPDKPAAPLVVAAASALEAVMGDRLGESGRYGRDLARALFDRAQQVAQPDPRRIETLRSLVVSALGAYRNPAAHGRLDLPASMAREVVGLFSLLAREVEAIALPVSEGEDSNQGRP